MSLFRHIFSLVVLPLLVFSISYSYYRFIHARDYLVGYDATCNPAVESCYSHCEENDCEEPEYYAKAERYASALNELCGYDISGCDAANTCAPGEKLCSIKYCDTETEECAEMIPQPIVEGTETLEENSTEELQASSTEPM